MVLNDHCAMSFQKNGRKRGSDQTTVLLLGRGPLKENTLPRRYQPVVALAYLEP